MPNIYLPYDARLLHRAAGSAALTANTTLGTITQVVAQRTEFVTQVNLEAIKVSAANEGYTILWEVSNDSFATFETAEILSLGHTSVRLGGPASNGNTDVRQVLWSTEVNGLVYKDSRIRLIVAGTSPSITLNLFSSLPVS